MRMRQNTNIRRIVQASVPEGVDGVVGAVAQVCERLENRPAMCHSNFGFPSTVVDLSPFHVQCRTHKYKLCKDAKGDTEAAVRLDMT